MNTHGTGRSVPPAKQLASFIVSVVTKIVTRFSLVSRARLAGEARALLRSKSRGQIDERINQISTPLFVVVTDQYAAQRTYWEGIYYDLDVDLSAVPVPLKPAEGEWRLLFIPQGFTIHRAIFAYQMVVSAHNPAWTVSQYTGNLDVAVIQNTRTTRETYAAWVRDEQESDQEFCGQTTCQADPDQLLGITLLERLIHGMVHFDETKRHLDEKGITLCTGSRIVKGSVPCVRWLSANHQVYVYWCFSDSSFSDGGVRRAVALPQVAQVA